MKGRKEQERWQKKVEKEDHKIEKKMGGLDMA